MAREVSCAGLGSIGVGVCWLAEKSANYAESSGKTQAGRFIVGQRLAANGISKAVRLL
jgi:hypothetical protein